MSSYVTYEEHRGRSERDRRAHHKAREYVEEETFMQRRNGNRQLIPRRRDSSADSVEETRRYFPPERTVVRQCDRRTRSAVRDRCYDNDYMEIRGSGLYSIKLPRRADDDTCESMIRRYSSSCSESSPESRERREVLVPAGSRSRSRSRSHHRVRIHRRHVYRRRRHPSSSRSSSRSVGDAKIKQALKAAVTAGAVEAFRARHEPGGLSGPKGERILTAAVTAAGVDGVLDRDPDKHEKRHIVESALAGLVANRVIHGPSHS